jgi:hypothetical protein
MERETGTEADGQMVGRKNKVVPIPDLVIDGAGKKPANIRY